MPFNSFSFLFFLLIVLLLHAILPWRAGRWALLAASYIFYGFANPWYCLLLFLTSFVDFAIAGRIHRTGPPAARKLLLAASLVFSLGVLGFFKYMPFLTREVHWILPVGISFYTFQSLSYVIDIYRRKTEPCRDFTEFALYVAYFPQLIAGPIERADRLIPQLRQKQPVTVQDVEAGLTRALWGCVKKVVVADRMAAFVDSVYADPSGSSSTAVLIACFAFTFVLYLDFSAYTDIAIGVGRLMGVRISENFNWPYLARNPSDFWSRWHMTLTGWFRDYVYAPMGGTRRRKPWRTAFNLIFVMTLIGLWHGPNWNFVLFGFVGGVSVAFYHYLRFFSRGRKRGPLFGHHGWSVPLATGVTYSFTCFGLGVLFRAPDLGTVGDVYERLFSWNWDWKPEYAFHAWLIAACFALHVFRGAYHSERLHRPLPAPLRAASWCALILILLIGAPDSAHQFIYFQF